MILIVKVKKKLDCEANRKIESGQEIISELCSLQVMDMVVWVWVSDCEELVGVAHSDYRLGIT